MQSWFVVFRPKETSTPIQRGNNFSAPHALREIAGSWEVTFDPKWGGPDTPVKFERLSDWSTHPDQRLRFYSGTAVYKKTIELSADDIQTRNGRLTLDLGQVAVMARVQVNGMDCGIAWKPPYRVDISTAARPGHNSVEIHVVNLWINRMIGDEHLPEDSKWIDAETLAEWPEWFQNGSKRTSGRYTFTTAKHYKKESPLSSSGLLGPVKLQKLEFPD